MKFARGIKEFGLALVGALLSGAVIAGLMFAVAAAGEAAVNGISSLL